MPLPEEAAKSAKATHDLLRRFKELGTNMKSHPPPSAIEQDLQVTMARHDGAQHRVQLRCNLVLTDAVTGHVKNSMQTMLRTDLGEWRELKGERTVVDTFLEQLSVASRAAETLVAALEDTQVVTADFGTSLLKVGLHDTLLSCLLEIILFGSSRCRQTCSFRVKAGSLLVALQSCDGDMGTSCHTARQCPATVETVERLLAYAGVKLRTGGSSPAGQVHRHGRSGHIHGHRRTACRERAEPTDPLFLCKPALCSCSRPLIGAPLMLHGTASFADIVACCDLPLHAATTRRPKRALRYRPTHILQVPTAGQEKTITRFTVLQASVRVYRDSKDAVARTVAALGPLHEELAAAPAAARHALRVIKSFRACAALADSAGMILADAQAACKAGLLVAAVHGGSVDNVFFQQLRAVKRARPSKHLWWRMEPYEAKLQSCRHLSQHENSRHTRPCRALREREEALLTCNALADELDAKQGEIAGLEQEGSKARSRADLVRRPARRKFRRP